MSDHAINKRWEKGLKYFRESLTNRIYGLGVPDLQHVEVRGSVWMWEKANTDECRWMGRPPCALKVVNKTEVCIYLCCIIMALPVSSKTACLLSLNNCFIVTVAPWEGLCFDSSQSVGQKTAVVCVFVAISMIEIQAPWGSPGWSSSWLWLSAKNGERGASGGSAQLTDLHRKHRAWEPTREPKLVLAVEICS